MITLTGEYDLMRINTMNKCPQCSADDWTEIPYTDSVVCTCGVVLLDDPADEGIVYEFMLRGDIKTKEVYGK